MAGERYTINALAPDHQCASPSGVVQADVVVAVHCSSSDATLTAIAIKSGLNAALLTPSFTPATHDYRATLSSFPTTGAELIVSTRSPTAKLVILGSAATSSTVVMIPPAAEPKPIDIKVTAADGTTIVYTVVLSAS